MPSTNPWRIPVALHSNQSAMTLLHTRRSPFLIKLTPRPGKCLAIGGGARLKMEIGHPGYGFPHELLNDWSAHGSLFTSLVFFLFSIDDQRSLEKIMPSANTWCVPVPLHSSQSAMALLHSNHQAYLIT